VVQFVIDNFSTATRSSGKSRVKSVWVSGQESMITAALFIRSDWVWNTWAVGFWVESTALGSVLVVGVEVRVGGDGGAVWWQVFDEVDDEGSLNDASVGGAFIIWVFSVAISGDISILDKTVLNIFNSLGIAIINTVLFGVHFNTFVRVDQVSARSVHIINNFTVSKDGGSVDLLFLFVSPFGVQVTPTTVSVDWCETVGYCSLEGSSGSVTVGGDGGFDVVMEGFHGGGGDAESGR